jgi:hypothetical protein
VTLQENGAGAVNANPEDFRNPDNQPLAKPNGKIKEAPTRRKRLYIKDDEAPPGALVWFSWQERARLKAEWRDAVIKTYPNDSRALRLAWVLCDLAHARGFANASDEYLSSKVGFYNYTVNRTLAQFEKAGAIIRAHVPRGTLKWERRIFLGAAIINAQREQPQLFADLPPASPQRLASLGGKYRLNRHTQSTQTQSHARLDAERRERRRLSNDNPLKE